MWQPLGGTGHTSIAFAGKVFPRIVGFHMVSVYTPPPALGFRIPRHVRMLYIYIYRHTHVHIHYIYTHVYIHYIYIY